MTHRMDRSFLGRSIDMVSLSLLLSVANNHDPFPPCMHSPEKINVIEDMWSNDGSIASTL